METQNKQNSMVQMRVEDIEKAKELLNGMRREHLECEDGWYSCPLSEGGCFNDSRSGCDCGAEKTNRAIDEILALLPPTELPTHA